MMKSAMQVLCCVNKIMDGSNYFLSVFSGMTMEVPTLDQMTVLVIDLFMNPV